MHGKPRPTPLNSRVGTPLSHASPLAPELDRCPTHAPPRGTNVGYCSQRTAATSASHERARTPVPVSPSRTYQGLTQHFNTRAQKKREGGPPGTHP
jgi:hypothetical protein